LIWDDTPAKDLVNKPLFLVGLRTRGIATGYNFEEVKGIEAAVGGWRHLFEETTSNVALDYGGEHAIIWRSARITIRGESGAMLARAGEVPDGDMLREWFAVAFQSHEISPQTFPDVGSPSVGKVPFWKVALRVPEELMLKYWAVVPGFTLYSLDVEVANKGYISSQGLLTLALKELTEKSCLKSGRRRSRKVNISCNRICVREYGRLFAYGFVRSLFIIVCTILVVRHPIITPVISKRLGVRNFLIRGLMAPRGV
jgi:hypothetical protein